ncbi:TALPID3 protein-like [Lineus longissimus]|uniref:TALPID3 protein-like n=1 Tax=Lineus longissimus TaxID=88925 RepID=UPI00315C4C9E
MDETGDVLTLLNEKPEENEDSGANATTKSEANELLSITSAAVTALDTTTSSKEESGEASSVKARSVEADSARGESLKTEQINIQNATSPEGSEKQENTSHSSTASEILIRSTVMETDGDPLNASSLSRQNVHDSFFNESARRVKVPAKRLREIQPPFEAELNSTLDSTYGRKDSAEYVPPPLFQVPEKVSTKTKKRNGGLVQGRLDREESATSHQLDRGPWKRSNVSIERHFPDTTAPVSDGDGAAPMSEVSTTSSRTRGQPTMMMDTGVDYTNAADVSSASGGSSQPEIVDVPETIVTIHAQTSVSPSSASTASEGSSLGTQIQRRYQRNVSHVVQGAPVTGAAASGRQQNQDVKISKFVCGERERKAREHLAKRKEEGGPMKRVVKPTFVGPEESQLPKTSEGNQNANVRESITAAVAASAAIAITQPYMKAQQDLETKMSSVLERLSELSGKKQSRTPEENRRVSALERQLNDLTQKRLDFIENMQQQQLNWQANMMKYPKGTPCNYKPRHEPTPSNYSHPHDPHRKHYHPAAKDLKQDVRFSPESHPGDEDLRKGSPLDTPAPRMRPPMPTSYEDSGYRRKISPMHPEKSQGFLAEILAAHEDTPERDTDARRTKPCHHQAVRPAGQESRDEAKHLIKDQKFSSPELPEKTSQPKQMSSVAETPRNAFHVKMKSNETAPLDEYLMRPKFIPTSPYATLNDITRNQNADGSKSAVLDAEVILQKIQANRSCLEANLETILRSQQDADVYSLIDDLTRDGNAAERARIKKMVDETINAVKGEVQVEVEKDLAKLAAEKASAEEAEKQKEPVKSKGRPQVRGQSRGKGRIQARIDTGLRKKELEVEEEKKKVAKVLGKENVPKKTKEPPKKKKTIPQYKDEAYMTRVYGKAIYQSHRTTVKDPYLHYKNPVSPGPRGTARPTSVAEVRATSVKTAKIQTEQPRSRSHPIAPSGHFYFNPATGTTQQTHGFNPLPSEGHLIPMAIPLGPPRQGGQPVPFTAPSRSVIVSSHSPPKSPVPRVAEEGEGKADHLEKIVLPNMDIDSLPSGSPLQIESTPIAGQRERSTRMDESSIMEDQQGEGLEFPGYHQKQTRYHGPEFPPRVQRDEDPMPHIIKKRPNVLVQEISSDVIAGDIRRRDMLERNAVDWIEQELMARIITEMNNREPEPVDPTAQRDETGSAASEAHSGIAETIGQGGLQLFVDAGAPVDEILVNDLVREVLLEKIAAMTGRRTADQDEQAKRPQPKPRHPRPHPSSSEHEEYDEDVDQYVYHPHTDIPTPEPTPRPSPIHSSPPQIMSALTTPMITPEVSIGESETESAKELSAIWGMHPVVGPHETDNEEYSLRDDLDTPVATPRGATPPLSREETPVFDIRTTPCDKATSPIPQVLPPQTPPTPVQEVRTPSPPPRSPSPEPEPVVIEPKASSPPPLPPRHRRTPSPPRRESDTESTESTQLVETETLNESISEGEWLISRSEGQAAGIEIDPNRRGLIAQLMRGAEDSSVACSDIEHDDTDMQVDRSVGEFMTPKFRPEKDPVLQLLARMNLQQPDLPHYNQGMVFPQPQASGYPPQPSYSLGQVQPHMVEKSLGEISIAQPMIEQGDDAVFGHSQAATVRRRGQHMPSQGEIAFPREDHDDTRSLRLADLHLSQGEVTPAMKLHPSAHSTPAQDRRTPPQPNRQSPLRKSTPSPEIPQDLNASGARIIQVRSSIQDSPESTKGERSPSPTDKRASRAVSGQFKTSKEGEGMKNVSGSGQVLGTYPTVSEGMRTGTFTPDQLNMEGLLQSGYLTQTITDSEAGQSGQFGGTLEGTGDFGPNHLQASGTLGQSTSLGQYTGSLNRTDEESGSASRSSPDRPKPADRPRAQGPRVVNVTMPTAQETETETNEDISEISLGGTGEW